jgi:hypothetical protein
MKRLMITTSVVAALGLGICSTALAGDKGNKGGKQLGGSSLRSGQLQVNQQLNQQISNQQISNRNLRSQTLNSNIFQNNRNGLGQSNTPQMQTLNSQINGKKLMRSDKLGQIKDKLLVQDKGQNQNQDKGPKDNNPKQDKVSKHDKDQKYVKWFFKKNCDFKLYTGHCYIGQKVQFWSHCYFDPYYGCEIYYCPVKLCWYFWYSPWNCYLPCDYFVNVCEY